MVLVATQTPVCTKFDRCATKYPKCVIERCEGKKFIFQNTVKKAHK